MNELEEALARIAELEGELEQAHGLARERSLETLVTRASYERGLIDPEVTFMLLRPRLELDDDGNPVDLEEALDEVLSERPYLKDSSAHVPSIDGGARGVGAVDGPKTPKQRLSDYHRNSYETYKR